MSDPLSRRDALKVAAAGVVASGTAMGQDGAPAPGVTVRMHAPQNLESSFADQKDFITTNDQFFVRSHFPVPEIEEPGYKITVSGVVERPFELTLADLKALGATTRPVLLECAGNGRVFLVPQVRGLQWQNGAVGTAEWTGVPLSAVLEKAGVKPSAVEVILVGADKGTIAADPATPGPIHFDRSLPLKKAMQPEVMLAWAMNGEPLPKSHGGPLRLIVGGWYGMASVKWVSRIIVTEKPHQGYWQTFDYSYYSRRDGGLPEMTPITAIEPKAQIARPQMGETVPAGKPYTVRGAAWAGENSIARVEVSTDGGKTWQQAKLVGPEKPHCWRLWEWTWNVPAQAGPAEVLARTVDSAGRGQPEKRDIDRRSYMINHLIPTNVMVR